MNISAVSFGHNWDAVAPAGDMSYKKPMPEAQSDSFTNTNMTKKTTSHKQAHGKRHMRPTIKSYIAGLLTPLAIMGGVKGCEAKNAPKDTINVSFDSRTSSISRIADTYGVDPEVIYVHNNITEETDLSNVKELDIPKKYDYLKGKIEENEEKLHKEGLSDEKRMQLEEETLALRVKQKEQESVAKSYTDGDYIYYLVNTPEENPEMVETYGTYGIPSESFKALFDIKDGELKRFNDLSFIYRKDENPDGTAIRTYKDYTLSQIKYGSVIKVSTKAIDEKDISLKSFYVE